MLICPVTPLPDSLNWSTRMCALQPPTGFEFWLGRSTGMYLSVLEHGPEVSTCLHFLISIGWLFPLVHSSPSPTRQRRRAPPSWLQLMEEGVCLFRDFPKINLPRSSLPSGVYSKYSVKFAELCMLWDECRRMFELRWKNSNCWAARASL